MRSGLSDLAIHRRTGTARKTVARYRKRLGIAGYRATQNSAHCRHGHPFPANAAHHSNGWLYCRACARRRDRARRGLPDEEGEPDWVAVERTVAGDNPRPALTRQERQAVIAALLRKGATASTIADRAGVSLRTAYRWRARTGRGRLPSGRRRDAQ
ncbi:helix-turn-helix domain-containing protein [Streptomyces sp. NPDC054975]